MFRHRRAKLLIVVVAALSLPATRAAATAPTEADVGALYQQRSGQKADRVTRTTFGWWEVLDRGNLVYVNDDVSLVMVGPLLDARTKENLSQKRLDELLKIDWKTLPLANAIKIVRGNGARQFATFEDPNCGYCKRLATTLAGLGDSTQYVFLYPILSQDSSDKAKAIWCSKDRAAAWTAWMTAGAVPAPAAPDCKNPIQDNLALGQKAGVRGTPTLFFTDGSRLPGAMPLEQIQARLASSRAE